MTWTPRSRRSSSAAGAGRFRGAGGLVFARAAHAFAMHGDTARAIDLWRQAILLSSESRLYGDVLACRAALTAADPGAARHRGRRADPGRPAA